MVIFDKVKNLANGALDKSKEKFNKEEIQAKLSQGIADAVEKVSKERDEYYADNPAPSKESIESIIQNYSNQNALISGGAGLIPGPLGMAAAIPEIIAVMRNQLKMAYDIGKANGQDKITKELLIAIVFAGTGQSAVGLLVIHGQKVMAKRVGARALQSIIKILGGKITQQVAKSMAAKWIPLAGAVAMATWSKYSTHKIGNKAAEILSKEIEFLDTDEETIEEALEIEEVAIETLEDTSNELTKLKISSFINLMKIDGNIDDEEVKFIENFIDKSNLTSEEQMSLIEQIGSNEKVAVDYTLFKYSTEEALYLLIDLIAIAKVDGEFHMTEKMFIKTVGKSLEFDADDLKELME